MTAPLPITEDQAARAQAAGEAALVELEGKLEAGGCYCDTCVVREVLEAAAPILLEGRDTP